MNTDAPHYLIIDAPYYAEISAALTEGATGALEKAGAHWTKIEVPGVLEIPAALAMAVTACAQGSADYRGYILLGCVIRGETTHYDIVANESARAIMDLVTSHDLAVGNGIQTVENADQAWARAKVDDKNKGGGAAQAALAMAALKAEWGV